MIPFPPPPLGAIGVGVVPPGGGDPDPPNDQRGEVPEDGDLGVDGPGGRGAPPPEELVEHREAEPARHDGRADGPDDVDVLVEADEVVAEQREAGVVEGGDRVEDPLPEGLSHRVAVADIEPNRQDKGDHGLHQDHGDADRPKDALDVAHRRGAGLALGDQGLAQPQATAGQDGQQRGHRHDAEAADLDEHHDDELPEGRPIGRGVDHGQAGDAGRRHRGEGRREDVGGIGAVDPRDRQAQQHGADGEEDREDEWDEATRRRQRLHHTPPRQRWSRRSDSQPVGHLWFGGQSFGKQHASRVTC